MRGRKFISVLLMTLCLGAGITIKTNADVIVDNYQVWEALYNESGLTVKDGWLRLKNASGAYVWRYVDSKGEFLKDTVTPDGYKVNEFSNWYMHCPSAEICEVENYAHEFNGAVWYPFSYDGDIVRNDVLGISLLYGEKDYLGGYNLSMGNRAGAIDYGAFSVIMPDRCHIGFALTEHYTEPRLKEWISHLDAAEYIEQDVAGKHFIGRKVYYSNGEIYLYELYCQLPTGQDLVISSTGILGGVNVEAVLTWLNEHLALTF